MHTARHLTKAITSGQKRSGVVRTRSRARGFSLVEALVTVVVISVGLLGLAGLQFAGLRSVGMAHEHTVAVQLTQEIIERLRSNRTGVNDGTYNNVTLTTSSTSTPDCSGSVACNCASPTANCTSVNLYDFDRSSWYKSIIGPPPPSLPNLEISILQNAGVFTVTLRWGQNRTSLLTTRANMAL